MLSTVVSIWWSRRGAAASTRADNATGLAGGVALAALTLYLATRVGTYFNRDPLVYAHDIETVPTAALFLDKHHLLYRPLGALWFSLWQALGWKSGAILPLQVLSSLTAAAALALFFLAAITLLANRRAALVATAFLGLSYGCWRYAVEAYPHALLLLFLALSLFALTRVSASPTVRGALLLGGVIGLGSLFYQLVLFFLAPASVHLRGWRLRLLVLGGFLLTVAPACAWMAVRHLNPFTYTQAHGGWMAYGEVSWTNLPRAALGLGNLFLGENVALRNLESFPSADRWFRGHTGIPFAASPAAGGGAAGALGVLLVALAAALLLASGVHAVRRRRRLQPVTGVLCLAWFAPFAAFATWWFPENRQYWIGALPALALGFGAVVAAAPRWPLYALPPVLLAANLFGGLLPDRAAESPLFRQAALVSAVARPGDVVVCLGAGREKHLPAYLEYEARVTALDLVTALFAADPEAAMSHYHVLLEAALRRGQSAYWVESTDPADPALEQVVKYSGPRAASLRRLAADFLGAYRASRVKSSECGLRIYRLRPLPKPEKASRHGSQ